MMAARPGQGSRERERERERECVCGVVEYGIRNSEYGIAAAKPLAQYGIVSAQGLGLLPLV